MEEKSVKFEAAAPYATLNRLTDQTRKIWIVFHGYGMLARFFIRKFNKLNPAENFIIAPQGLSKFYLEGFSGRVGATWMTKENRITEIENQFSYIDQVLASEIGSARNRKVIFFGFSQGVATATRYLAHRMPDFDKLILWAGTFPEDIDKERAHQWPRSTKIIYVTGLQDPFLKDGMIAKQHEVVSHLTGLEAERIEFDGKHEVIPEIVTRL